MQSSSNLVLSPSFLSCFFFLSADVLVYFHVFPSHLYFLLVCILLRVSCPVVFLQRPYAVRIKSMCGEEEEAVGCSTLLLREHLLLSSLFFPIISLSRARSFFLCGITKSSDLRQLDALQKSNMIWNKKYVANWQIRLGMWLNSRTSQTFAERWNNCYAPLLWSDKSNVSSLIIFDIPFANIGVKGHVLRGHGILEFSCCVSG